MQNVRAHSDVLEKVISTYSAHNHNTTLGRLDNTLCRSDEKRLVKHLIENYHKIGLIGRPVYNVSGTALQWIRVRVPGSRDTGVQESSGSRWGG